MRKSKGTAIVIGSGVGGLATAVRLARRGYAVKVLAVVGVIVPRFGGTSPTTRGRRE